MLDDSTANATMHAIHERMILEKGLREKDRNAEEEELKKRDAVLGRKAEEHEWKAKDRAGKR